MLMPIGSNQTVNLTKNPKGSTRTQLQNGTKVLTKTKTLDEG
jgi:hypothetical protein